MFRYVVLGLLQNGAAQHGYALMKEYRDRAGVQVSTGNFYRDLQRLVSAGLVRTADRAPDHDPRRAPYLITEPGREAFRQWFIDVLNLGIGNTHEDELSARIAFLGDVDPSDARLVLDHLQDELWARAKSLERARSAALASATGDPSRGLPVLALMLGRRMRRLGAELAFLEDLRASYDEWLGARAAAEAPRITVTRRAGETPPLKAASAARKRTS
jgi:DNA-binding PadR family transcriptional regulator